MQRRDFIKFGSSMLLLGFGGANALYADNKSLFTPKLLYLSKQSGGIPNSPLPLIVYNSIIPNNVADKAGYLESLFADNSWIPAWRYHIFNFHHFHSTAHECVACFSGNATLQVGGEGGDMVNVNVGDVLVIPAGVGHRQVSASSDFTMVGAYPINQRADVCRDEIANLNIAKANIAKVPLPNNDPLGQKTWRG